MTGTTMPNSETALVCGVLVLAAAVVGWLVSGSSHRRRFELWKVEYQRQLRDIVHRESVKAGAEISKLKSEIVKLKAERMVLQSRERAVELKGRLAALPRLTEAARLSEATRTTEATRMTEPAQATAPALARDPSGDGFEDTQPFEQHA